MKKRSILLLLCLTSVVHLFSQVKHDYQWVLDHYNLLDFRNDNLEISVLDHAVNNGSGDYSTSVCDREGELLFYSGGCHILNSNNDIMENGDSINSEYGYIDFCGFGDFPMRQNNTVIPFPGDNQKYIYFNIDIHILDDMAPAPLHLYYHIIDMEKDGGLGAVVEKKSIAVADTLSRGYVQAVQHSNGMDWWVIAAEWNSNCYYIIPVTANGVGPPEVQCIGGVWNNRDGGGQAVFSPDGTKFARIEAVNGWYLFDFDASTGILSNPLELMGMEEENYFRGAAFSPDSRYLYVSARLDLFQFDLEADDIQGSIQLVGQLDPEDAIPGVGSLALQRLAPNGKIYIASPGAHKYLSVINRPNCPGTLCDFRPWALELPESNYSGLPNLPHFSIPESDTACDPLVSTTELFENTTIEVFPNPTTGIFRINGIENSSFKLFDATGNFLQEIDSKEVDLGIYPTGLYFLQVTDGKKMLTRRIVKID